MSHSLRRPLRWLCVFAVIVAAVIGMATTARAQSQPPDVTYHVEIPAIEELGDQVNAIHRITTDYAGFGSYGFAICNDPGELLPIDVEPGPSLPPPWQIFFYDAYIEPGGAGLSCILSGVGSVSLPTGIGHHITTVRYEVVGGNPGENAIINYCEMVNNSGGSAVSYFNWLYFEGATLLPELVIGYPRFKRGDGNADGAVDIADVIWHLDGLFTGGPWGVCQDAKDVNDNGGIDLADPIFILSFLFVPGSPPPPPPFPLCGDDLTPDLIDCEQSTGDC